MRRLIAPLMSIAAAAAAFAPLACAADDPNDYPSTIAQQPPMIGMFPGEVPDEVARAQGLPPNTGVYVLGTIDGSMAQGMGLKQGDVVISFNGIPVNNYDEIVAARDRYHAGDRSEMIYVRDGQTHAATGTLGHWPHADEPVVAANDPQTPPNSAAQPTGTGDALPGTYEQARDEILRRIAEASRSASDSDRSMTTPWHLDWRSRAVDDQRGSPVASTEADAPATTSPPSDEPAWRLSWSNAVDQR